jgi:D-cysteine desulfhydrase
MPMVSTSPTIIVYLFQFTFVVLNINAFRLTDTSGNVLLNRMVGAHVTLMPPVPFETGLKPAMEAKQRSLAASGHESVLIPVGGSDHKLGIWGYIDAFNELLTHNHIERDNITDIVMAIGSGGTTAGLSIANHLSGNRFGIHAVAVCDDARYFHGHINDALRALGITNTKSESIVNIIEGYKGRGYALSTPEELKFINEVTIPFDT